MNNVYLITEIDTIDTQLGRQVDGQRLRTYKHIERNQGKQQQVRSNQINLTRT